MAYLTNAGAIIREACGGYKRSGSFSQNYLAVLSGTGLNILIQVIVSPVLARIYGPEAYGMYALFTAICSNFAMLATMRFPQAFLLPKEDREFHVLMRLSFLTSIALSIVVSLFLAFNGGAFLKALKAESLMPYFYLIPVMILLISANQIFGQWQYRLNVFKKSVAIDTSLLVSVRFFNLIFGWLTNGMHIGLILGDGLGKIAGLILSVGFIIKGQIREAFSRISFLQMKEVFLAYKAYPLINLPGVWLVLTSEQLPFFLLTSKFGLPALGVLAFAISMLDLPKRLFAYSVSSVFYKKAVDLYAESFSRFQDAVTKMFYGLLLLSAVPYSIIFIFGPMLFTFVFGVDWELSGKLAQYLALYYVLELICVSFDAVFYTLRKEKQLFHFQISAFAGRFAVLLTAVYAFETLELCIASLMAFNVVLYSVQLITVLRYLKLPAFKFFIHLVSIMGLLVALMAGLKMFLDYLFNNLKF
ncbi:MAG: oligosaccharide flippase family protein [Chryseosolibacter sp.]